MCCLSVNLFFFCLSLSLCINCYDLSLFQCALFLSPSFLICQLPPSYGQFVLVRTKRAPMRRCWFPMFCLFVSLHFVCLPFLICQLLPSYGEFVLVRITRAPRRGAASLYSSSPNKLKRTPMSVCTWDCKSLVCYPWCKGGIYIKSITKNKCTRKEQNRKFDQFKSFA